MATAIPFAELFAGIGGFSAAVRLLPVRVVAAFDQDAAAREVYQQHFGPISPIDLCGLGPADHGLLSARGWWLSPPCQPYTRKGRQLDVDDARARPLLHLIRRLPDYRPEMLLLENVPPFAESRSRGLLVEALRSLKMDVTEALICPSDFGIPNRRNRYYLLASKLPISRAPAYPDLRSQLGAYTDAPSRSGHLPRELVERLDPNRNIVDICGTPGVFGSSYGRAIHGAGSYLDDGRGIRRFTPEEIMRLLHFPDDVRFPATMSTRTRYKLAGNSVNVAVVQYLVEWLIGGEGSPPSRAVL